MHKFAKHFYILLIIIVSLGVILNIGNFSSLAAGQNKDISLLPGIEAFLKMHPEYGTVIYTEKVSDWANGKREKVKTSTGEYLFYMYNNEVVGIDKYTKGQRSKIFHKDIPQLPENVTSKADRNLPSYKILSLVNLASGGKYGEILIPNYSRKTPKELRGSTLRQIAVKEGFAQADLYSTEDAFKANASASYLKTHPNALKKGFLGSLNQDGTFTPGETLYP